MRLIISWFVNAVALAVAAWLIPGIQVTDSRGAVAVVIMAIIFGPLTP